MPSPGNTRSWLRLIAAAALVYTPTLAEEPDVPQGNMPAPTMTLSEIDRLLAIPEGEEFEFGAVNYFSRGDSTVMRGDAWVTHRGARLEAGEMVYHHKAQLVEARALIDSSGDIVDTPTLKKGSDLLRGERILYDMESGEGTIFEGRIAFKKGFYGGEFIETRPEEEFHVHAGSYTTCDSPEPHFDFYSPRIKVLAGDMAIARPVYFRIGETRLFWVPFYVFSLREDRQSGLLTPGFGRRPLSFASQESEWEVRNLGYYFAPSEHWDLLLSSNLRQRSGWLGRGRVAYARRYHFDGRVETRLENRQTNGNVRWESWTTFRHNQQLSPSASIRASGTFQSSKNFTRDNSDVLQERLNRTLRTNVRFDQRWRQAGYTLNVSARRNENLDTDSFDEVRPEISIRSNPQVAVRSGKPPTRRAVVLADLLRCQQPPAKHQAGHSGRHNERDECRPHLRRVIAAAAGELAQRQRRSERTLARHKSAQLREALRGRAYRPGHTLDHAFPDRLRHVLPNHVPALNRAAACAQTGPWGTLPGYQSGHRWNIGCWRP